MNQTTILNKRTQKLAITNNPKYQSENKKIKQMKNAKPY